VLGSTYPFPALSLVSVNHVVTPLSLYHFFPRPPGPSFTVPTGKLTSIPHRLYPSFLLSLREADSILDADLTDRLPLHILF